MIYVRFQAIGRHFLGIRNNGTYNIFPQLRTTSFLSAHRSDYSNASSDVKPLQHHSTQLDFPFISTFNKNKEADKNLRLIFDDPDVWTNFISRSHTIAPLERDILSSKEKLTGLFRNPELATPQGFRTAAEKVLRRAKLLVHRITNAKTDDELRKVVKNLDRLSDMLCSVIDTAEFVRATHPDPKFSQSANWAYEHLYSYMNFLNTNRDLWKVLKRVMSTQSISSQFSAEEFQVAQIFLRDFEKSGIHLPSSEREQFVRLSDKVITLGRKFTHNLQPNSNDYIEVDVSLLDGLKTKFPTTSKSNVVNISTKTWEVPMIMKQVKNEEVRESIYIASNSATKEHVELLEDLLRTRGEIAKLLGMESYSQLFLMDKMAKNPENVQTFLHSLADHHRPKALADLRLLQEAKMKYTQSKKLPTIYAWDRDFYIEKVRLNSSTQSVAPISQYFSVGSVIQGLSKLFSRLYGISFEPADIWPGEVWHEDVRKLDVIDESEGRIGTIYCDLFSRFGKYQNAAHYTVRCSRRVDDDDGINDIPSGIDPADLGELATSNEGETIKGRAGRYQLPVVVLVCDFGKPKNSKNPSLLSWVEVETLFHEMGHAMHSMIGRTDFHNVSGTRCPTDFVELPSILMEHFVHSPSVLSLFAKHFETRAPIPLDLIYSHRNARSKFSAMETQHQILMALLDQLYHSNLANSSTFDTTAILANLQDTVGLYPSVPGTAWQVQFGHLYSYGATYYSYLFCRVLAGKIWQNTFEKDPLCREAGGKFREEVLRWGGARDPWSCIGEVLKDERIMAGDNKSVSIVGEWVDYL